MPDSAGLDFQFLRCSCVCTVARQMVFSEAGGGNDLRGALGYVLPEEWFRPRADEGPSGLRDVPRPFVLRVSGLQDSVMPGGVFRFGVNVFDLRARATMEPALREIARSGIGRARTPFVLRTEWETVRRSLATAPEGVESLRVEFVTPAELKGHETPGAPPFHVLMARARDRVSALRMAYGGGAPALDFRGLGERARAVRLVESQLEHEQRSRVSSRTGQRQELKGWTGRARYEGAMDEFLPVLRAAEHTGVGRHTVWGQGEIRVTADSTGSRHKAAPIA